MLKAVSASCATSAEFTLELLNSMTLFISTDLRSMALVLLSGVEGGRGREGGRGEGEKEGGKKRGKKGGRKRGKEGGREGGSNFYPEVWRGGANSTLLYE